MAAGGLVGVAGFLGAAPPRPAARGAAGPAPAYLMAWPLRTARQRGGGKQSRTLHPTGRTGPQANAHIFGNAHTVRVLAGMCLRSPRHAESANGSYPQTRTPLTRACTSSRGADEGSSQVLIYCLLGDPERTSNTDRLQFAGGHQAIHGHLRHAHDQGHFGNREEPYVAKGSIACHAVASSARSRALDGIQRTSHVRLQRKSRTQKSNPIRSLIVVTFAEITRTRLRKHGLPSVMHVHMQSLLRSRLRTYGSSSRIGKNCRRTCSETISGSGV